MNQYIVFVNNEQTFALDISKVERIIEFVQPKPVPESSEYLLGIIKYNDHILPIIDLTMRLYGKSCCDKGNRKIIVINWKEKTLGLVVEDIKGIHSFGEEHYEEKNQDLNISKEYIEGFIKTEDDITIVLNTDKIFNMEQEEELTQAVETAEERSEEVDVAN